MLTRIAVAQKKSKTIIGVLLILFSFPTQSQSFCSLSKFEKRWVLLHPIAATKIYCINKRAQIIYKDTLLKFKLDSFSNGGKLDAFRHVFFMASFTQKVKAKKVLKLGQAHEKGNYLLFLKEKREEGELPDSLGTVMDLLNNKLGVRIGKKHNSLNLEELKEVVIDSIKNGEAYYIRRNLKGEYCDCNYNPIQLDKSKKRKWFIAKCLIPTNE